MLKRLPFLLLLILLLLIAGAATTPLRFVADKTAYKPPPWVSSLSGTIMDGGMQINLATLSPPTARAVTSLMSPISIRWQWCPGKGGGLSAWCVTAKSYKLETSVDGIVELSPSAVAFSDLTWLARFEEVVMPIPRFPPQPVSVQLQLSLDNARVSYDNPFPTEVRGRLSLNQLSVSNFAIGNFRASLRSGKGSALDARIQGGGELLKKLAGKATLTAKSYRYELNVNSSNPVIRSFLEQKGKRASGGGFFLVGNDNW